MHPVLLQKIYGCAHLRQEQAVAQGYYAQWRGRPLIALEHSLQPSVSEFGSPSSAYFATAPSFSAQRMRPTRGFSPGNCAFVELTLDLPIELSDRPPAAKRLCFVKLATIQITHRQ
jgi:hypothetical protein